MGSRPLVAQKRSCTPKGVMVQPWVERWQVPQERPLVPRVAKNGLSGSIVPVAVALWTRPALSSAGASMSPHNSCGVSMTVSGGVELQPPQTPQTRATSFGDFRIGGPPPVLGGPRFHSPSPPQNFHNDVGRSFSTVFVERTADI